MVGSTILIPSRVTAGMPLLVRRSLHVFAPHGRHSVRCDVPGRSPPLLLFDSVRVLGGRGASRRSPWTETRRTTTRHGRQTDPIPTVRSKGKYSEAVQESKLCQRHKGPSDNPRISSIALNSARKARDTHPG